MCALLLRLLWSAGVLLAVCGGRRQHDELCSVIERVMPSQSSTAVQELREAYDVVSSIDVLDVSSSTGGVIVAAPVAAVDLSPCE